MTESTFLRRTALQIFKSLKILTIYTPICFHINSWQTFLLRIPQTCLYASQNRAEHFILGLFLKLKHCSYKWLKKSRKLVFYTLYIVEYLCFPTRYFRWLAVLPVNSVVGTFICKHPFGILISACTIVRRLWDLRVFAISRLFSSWPAGVMLFRLLAGDGAISSANSKVNSGSA